MISVRQGVRAGVRQGVMPRQGAFAGAYNEEMTLPAETGTHTLIEEVTGTKEISEVTLQTEEGTATADLQVNGETVTTTTIDTTETVLEPEQPVSSDDTVEVVITDASVDLGPIDVGIRLGL